MRWVALSLACVVACGGPSKPPIEAAVPAPKPEEQPAPEAGKPCKVDHLEACTGPATALACNDSVWTPLSCKGAKACEVLSAKQGYCDQSTAELGDVCNMDSDHACTGDHASMLVCMSHAWKMASPCKGALSCALDAHDKAVHCDTSLADENDDCDASSPTDRYACTVDGTRMLRCDNRKFSVVSTCTGPKACAVASGKVTCDDSIARPGDPCDHVTDSYACAADHRAILKCVEGRFQPYDACSKKRACVISAGTVACR